MSFIPVGKDIVEVNSVSWSDLCDLRPLQVISFKDRRSWALVFEWCDDMKSAIGEVTMASYYNGNMFFYEEIRKRTLESSCMNPVKSVDFMADVEHREKVRDVEKERTAQFICDIKRAAL